MEKAHDVQAVRASESHLYLTVDGKAYRIRWIDCSPLLAKANDTQRQRFEVSPSGYGIHWSELDEDLAFTTLLKNAELLESQAVS